MKIYEFKKEEISQYLKDCYYMIAYALYNPNVSFQDAFQKSLYIEKRYQYATLDYYMEMINIFVFFLVSKNLTISYDNVHNFLREKSIDNMNFPSDIFVNKEDYKRFSKKQIIDNIRIALNHNDNDNHDLYKFIRILDEDNKYRTKIEIDLKNSKPIPFHVIIDADDLLKITEEVNKANMINVFSFQSKGVIDANKIAINSYDGLYLRKFFARKKLTDEQIEKISNICKVQKETIGYEEELKKYGLEYKDFYYTQGQKTKIMEDLYTWKKAGVEPRIAFYHVASNAMPFAVTKQRTIVMLAAMLEKAYKERKTSFFDFKKEVADMVLEQKIDDSKSASVYANIFGLDNNTVLDVLDGDELSILTSSIYYGNIFESLITDDYVHITDKKNIERKRIRDAFVHLRWIHQNNRNIKLYDWGNSIDDEFNSKRDGFWTKSISIAELQNYSDKNIKSSNIDMPIRFMNYDKNIVFIKDNIQYNFIVDNDDAEKIFNLYVMDQSQEQRLATEEEKEVFIKELNNLSDKEKKEHASKLSIIIDRIAYNDSTNKQKHK